MKPKAEEWSKWQAIKAAEGRDYLTPLMQRLGNHLACASYGNPEHLAKLCMAYARDCISFVSDLRRVGREDLDTPDGVVKRGRDDCDGKARLFVALCKAAGLTAELLPLWEPEKESPADAWLSHIYAQVWLGGKWVPVELTLRRAQLGDDPAAVPREIETGLWLR